MNHPRFFITVFGIWALTAAGILSGCTWIKRDTAPARVSSEHLLPMDTGGSGPAFWEGDEIHLTYTTEKTDVGLEFRGQIKLAGGIQYFTSFDHMKIELFFTDADGTVLARRLLYSAGYRVPIDAWAMQFHRTLPCPQGATHMAFGYDGRVREGGGHAFKTNDGGATDYTFWFSPLK